MTVVPQAEPVGRLSQKGFALELRHIKGTNGDLDAWRKVALELLGFGRQDDKSQHCLRLGSDIPSL
jgi:hypothetical protein